MAWRIGPGNPQNVTEPGDDAQVWRYELVGDGRTSICDVRVPETLLKSTPIPKWPKSKGRVALQAALEEIGEGDPPSRVFVWEDGYKLEFDH